MKKVFKVLVNLALLFVICVPVFSQPNSRSVETFVIDNFDEEKEWSWKVNASRFIAKDYPKYGMFSGIPNSLKPFQPSDVEPKVLGIQSAYNRKGDNWFEVLPIKDDNVYEIPFIGHVTDIDFWVWGANYLYYLELMVRDAEGRVHILPAGNLAFNGWKNIVIKVPGWIPQRSKLRSGPKTLTFLGFRVRSDASEYVDDFTIYFDNLKYTSNSLSFIYDGYELQETDFSDAESGSYGSEKSSSEPRSEDGK